MMPPQKPDAASTFNRDVGMDDRSRSFEESGVAMAARRPLSPHLGIYRLPLTALVSITHRVTGALLVVGMLALVICLMAGAAGESTYAQAHAFLDSTLGRTFIWLWIYALFFHLCHGIRHLVWDMARGFERDRQDFVACLEITASSALTVALFLSTRLLWG